MSKIVSARQGVGIGYRVPLDTFIQQNKGLIDVLEVIPEHYSAYGRLVGLRRLMSLREDFKLIVHGIASTLVSTTRPKKEYMSLVRTILDITGSPYFSDHAMMTGADGFALGHLCPNLYDKVALRHAIENAVEMEETLGVPLVVEYSTYTVRFPGSTWTPEEFFLEFVNSHPTLGILIDLSNVWYNGTNFGFDYRGFVSSLPADQVVHVHLAGGEVSGAFWNDTHSREVNPEVFGLLELLCKKADPDTVIIERDGNYPEALADLPPDLMRAKEIVSKRRE